MDIPMAINRRLVFVLQALIEDEYLPYVDNIIWNGEVNIQRLEQVQNILIQRNQLHVLAIVQRTLAGKDKINAGCCNKNEHRIWCLNAIFGYCYTIMLKIVQITLKANKYTTIFGHLVIWILAFQPFRCIVRLYCMLVGLFPIEKRYWL